MPLDIDIAFVPAAGLGTRMRHLTEDRPKPLVEVHGRRLIDRVLDRIAAAGIPTAIVNVHYKADLIEEALRQGRSAPRIVISDERDELLDTGGGIAKALPMIGGAPFLVHNSDSIWVDDQGSDAIAMLRAAWNGTAMDCLMLLARRETSMGYDGAGDFSMRADGQLMRRGAATAADYVFTGVSIVDPRLFSDAPAGPFSLNVLWDRALARGRVFGVVLNGRWMHVGTPEAVDEASRTLGAIEQKTSERG